MALAADDLDAIRRRQGARVERVATARGPVVVKRQRAPRAAWRSAANNALAALLRQCWMRVVPAPTAAAAQAVEVARLRALHAAGIAVPALLHVDAGFIVLECVEGPTLTGAIAAGGVDAWVRGLNAIAGVHRAGQYLAQAFARNCIDSARGVVMIDFEDDPLAAMPLADAQVRDWMTYLHSTLWTLDCALRPALRSTFAGLLARDDAAVRQRVAASARQLGALRHLPRSRRPWGREIVGLQALAAFLHPLA